MKKFLFMTLMVAALFTSAKIYADNPEDYSSEMSYDVCLYEVSANEAPPEEVIPDPIKQKRIPSKRLFGTISLANGIEIPGINIEDFHSFEIYDENDGCLGTFSDPEDFVQAIFLYNESLKIRLLTADFVLAGYL